VRHIPKIFLSYLLLTFFSCQPTTTNSQALRINTRSEPRSLDPRCSRDISTATIQTMLFDGLFRLDENNEPIPSLAKKVEISENKKIYTFYLREATWSDGHAVTADDFVYTWQSSLSPSFPSEQTQHLYLIKNARNIKLGQMDAKHLGARALSDTILEVELENPTPYFLQVLFQPIFFAVPKHIDSVESNWMNNPQTFVCNGPFILKNWNHGSQILAIKNPMYWDANSVRLNDIIVSMVEDEHTEFYMFENGELDWAGSPNSSIPHDAIQSLKAEGLLHISPMAEFYCFKFNTKAPPFDNIKMRKAFGLAMNREKIITNILQSEQIPALRVFPPILKQKAISIEKDQDEEKALALFNEALAEMKIEKEELPPVILTFTRCEKHQRISEALQQQWQKVFGISIKLQSYEWNIFLDHLRRHNFQIAGRGWVADFIDPLNFLDMYKYNNDHPLGGNNDTNWHNKDFTALIQKSESIANQDERLDILIDAEKLLLDEYPIAPFLFAQQCYVQSPRLKGVILSPTCRLDFKWAYFEKQTRS
jgi:oligopeptide transport system substrate-binding protein